MISGKRWWVVVAGVCFSIGGCAGSADVESGDLGALSHPLAGSIEVENCGDETLSLELSAARARTVARSAAFLHCIMNVGNRGEALDSNGPFIGPYPHCSEDALAGESQSRQVARIANVLNARNRTIIRCVPGGTCSAPKPDTADACANEIDPGEDALVRWESVGGQDSNSGLLAHELGHVYDYWHGDCSNESANAMLNRCVREINEQAGDAPDCASLACGSDEMATPRFFKQVEAGDTCVCTPNVWENENEAGDAFGHTLAVADFDGDLFFDLAVGAHAESSARGVVYVFRGSSVGLRFWRRIRESQLVAVNYQESTTPFAVSQQAGDEFGRSLAVGDFNKDGFYDLLVGAPGKGSGSGVVFLLPGSPMGPDTQHVQFIDQRESGGSVEPGDRFGDSLVVGFFDSDAHADFAIGAPYEVSSFPRGAVSIHRGRQVAVGAGTFETSDTILLGLGSGDEFGYALAYGDMDEDGLGDLIVGAPARNSGAGAVYRYERAGSSWGSVQTMAQTTTRFGDVLATGDFIGNHLIDLAVGAPHHGGDKGAVFTYRGNSNGALFAQTLVSNETDQLGASLAVAHVVGDTSPSAKADLLAGRPGEAFGTGEREGVVAVYAGVTGTQLATPTELDQYAFNLGSSGDALMEPEAHQRDRFGAAVVGVPDLFGRITGVFRDNVAVGAFTDSVAGVQSGSVFIFRGTVADRKLDQETMMHHETW
jgi:hypothetical protein